MNFRYTEIRTDRHWAVLFVYNPLRLYTKRSAVCIYILRLNGCHKMAVRGAAGREDGGTFPSVADHIMC